MIDTELTPAALPPTLAEKVVVTTAGCWEWRHATRNGYGRVSLGGRLFNVHRVAYEHIVGPIPDGLHIDHLCRNRSCCNPHHLEPVTAAENNRRAPRCGATTTHCARGHERTSVNTRERTDRRGRTHRDCRPCEALRSRSRRVAVTA